MKIFAIIRASINFRIKHKNDLLVFGNTILQGGLCLVEMAVIEALASFVASQPFAFFVPFALAKDGRLRFRLPHKKEIIR